MIARRIALLAAFSFSLAACSGGSTAPGTTSVTKPPTTSGATAPNAHGTLTIAFPPTFATAHKKSTSAGRAITSLTRGPAYVNPTAGNLLDIYVNGTLQTNLDGSGSNNDSALVSTSSDQTQTLSIPLYSGQTNDVSIIEWDTTKQYLLALGETSVPSFQSGTSPVIVATLLMNVQQLVIANTPNNPYGGVAQSIDLNDLESYKTADCDPYPYHPPTDYTFSLFAADAIGGYVNIPGTGNGNYAGVNVIPSIASQSSAGTSSVTLYQGAYYTTFDGNNASVVLDLTIPNNPAVLATTDQTQYPYFYYSATSPGQLNYLVNSYINNSYTQGLLGNPSGSFAVQVGCQPT